MRVFRFYCNAYKNLDYMLSNNHINNMIIAQSFDFKNQELLSYYMSFLKTLSLKLDTKYIHFFFNEVWSFIIMFIHFSESGIKIPAVYRGCLFLCPPGEHDSYSC